MTYFPILLSKAGEFKALKETEIALSQETCPVIEILRGAIDRTERSLSRDWSFEGNEVILDFSNYGTMDAADIADINNLFTNLIANGVNIIPAVQNNSPAAYIALVANCVLIDGCDICIRASNASNGFANFMPDINALMVTLGVTRAKTIILVDLGYVEAGNRNILAGMAVMLLNTVPAKSQWKELVIASGSFPENLTHLLPAGIVHRLPRHEWYIWNQVHATAALIMVKYGDYGNKNPVYGGEGGYAGSCSIKYSNANEFVVYRGELSRDHPDGHGQYITFAGRLVASLYYSGPGFSWGDRKIATIAAMPVSGAGSHPGNATSWVEITQNHHIALLHTLL